MRKHSCPKAVVLNQKCWQPKNLICLCSSNLFCILNPITGYYRHWHSRYVFIYMYINNYIYIYNLYNYIYIYPITTGTATPKYWTPLMWDSPNPMNHPQVTPFFWVRCLPVYYPHMIKLRYLSNNLILSWLVHFTIEIAKDLKYSNKYLMTKEIFKQWLTISTLIYFNHLTSNGWPK